MGDDRQNSGEATRQALGIDGTAGDAQDVDHPYAPADDHHCLTCGLAPNYRRHQQAGRSVWLVTDDCGDWDVLAAFATETVARAWRDSLPNPLGYRNPYSVEEWPLYGKESSDG